MCAIFVKKVRSTEGCTYMHWKVSVLAGTVCFIENVIVLLAPASPVAPLVGDEDEHANRNEATQAAVRTRTARMIHEYHLCSNASAKRAAPTRHFTRLLGECAVVPLVCLLLNIDA